MAARLSLLCLTSLSALPSSSVLVTAAPIQLLIKLTQPWQPLEGSKKTLSLPADSTMTLCEVNLKVGGAIIKEARGAKLLWPKYTNVQPGS